MPQPKGDINVAVHICAPDPEANIWKPIRVLLVDDNPIFLKILTDFLQRYDDIAVVGAAHEGKEALTLAEALRPRVILLDLRMPGPSGFEVIPRLRASLPGIGIIVLTLCEEDVYRQAALAVGADDFVPKRTLSTSLMPAIWHFAYRDC